MTSVFDSRDLSSLRTWTALPVWLIGTSRGTVSLSHLSGHLPIDGVIFTASVTEISDRRPATALDGDLEKISVPVLLAHHRGDNCYVTPAWGVSAIAKRLRSAPHMDTMFFTGGSSPRGSDCGATSQHGFIGLERDVVNRMVRWMFVAAPD